MVGIQSKTTRKRKGRKAGTKEATKVAKIPESRTVIKSLSLGTLPERWRDSVTVALPKEEEKILNPFKAMVQDAFSAQCKVIDKIYEGLNGCLMDWLPLVYNESVVPLNPQEKKKSDDDEEAELRLPKVANNSEILLTAQNGESTIIRLVSPFLVGQDATNLKWEHPLGVLLKGRELGQTVSLAENGKNGGLIQIPGLSLGIEEVRIEGIKNISYRPLPANSAAGVISDLIPLSANPYSLEKLEAQRQKKFQKKIQERLTAGEKIPGEKMEYQTDEQRLKLAQEFRSSFSLPVEVNLLHSQVRESILPGITIGYAAWITKHFEKADVLAQPPNPRAPEQVKKKFIQGLEFSLRAITTRDIMAANDLHSQKWEEPYPIRYVRPEATALVYFLHKEKPESEQSLPDFAKPLCALFKPKNGSLFLLVYMVSETRGHHQKVQVWNPRKECYDWQPYQGIAKLDPWFSKHLHLCEGQLALGKRLGKKPEEILDRMLKDPTVILIPLEASDKYRALLLPQSIWPFMYLTEESKKEGRKEICDSEKKKKGRDRKLVLEAMKRFRNKFLGHSSNHFELRALNLSLQDDQIQVSQNFEDWLKPNIPVRIQAGPDVQPRAFLTLAPSITGEWAFSLVDRDGKNLNQGILPGIPQYLASKKVTPKLLRFDRKAQSYKGRNYKAAQNLMKEIISKYIVEPVLKLASQHCAQVVVIGAKQGSTVWQTISRVSGFHKVVKKLQTEVPLQALPEMWHKGGRTPVWCKENLFFLLSFCPVCGAQVENSVRGRKAWSLKKDRFECGYCQKQKGEGYQPLRASFVAASNGARLRAEDWKKEQEKEKEKENRNREGRD